MIKTTYVPNIIRIPTHRVDFSHQGLGFGGRTQNRQWSHHKVSRGEERKKEKKRGGINRKGKSYSADESRHVVGTTLL
jgi:hypothetical protein